MKDDLVECLFKDLNCTEPLTKAFIDIVLGDIQLFDRKQHDYGSENIAAFGELGVLVRANDKMARLHHLSGQVGAKNEAVEDSWTDLSIYGVIGRLVRACVWPGCCPTPPNPPESNPTVGTRVRVVAGNRFIHTGWVGTIQTFNGLPAEYRFAVLFNGQVWCFKEIPGCTDGVTVEWCS